ncbi:MAG: GAF domain-containing protein [Chloroflexota bacterium]
MRSFLLTIKNKFLYINSEDNEVLRKGRLIQFLVLLLAFVNIGFLFFSVLQTLITNPLMPTFSFVSWVLPLLFVLLAVCWWLARNGRIRQASHLFSTGTIVIFLIEFLINPNPAIPYLMLVGVVAMAVLDTVRTSTIYAIITLTLVSLLFTFNDDFTFLDISRYLLTTVGICITIWVTARDLKENVRSTQKLNRDIFQKNSQLQRNSNLLQLSSEVAQLTGQSLNLEILLKNSVNLIRDRFGFYYVAIYLHDENNSFFVLKEATGTVGQNLIDEKFKLSLAEMSLVTDSIRSKQPQYGKPQPSHPTLQMLSKETKTELALPLISRGEIKGVLDLHSRTESMLNDQDIAAFEIMANQLAVNIDNAILYADAEKQFNETKILFDFNNFLTETFDTGEIYRRIAFSLSNYFNATVCQIYSWDAPQKHLSIQANYSKKAINEDGEYLPLGSEISFSPENPTFKALQDKASRQVSLYDQAIGDLDQKSLEQHQQHHLLEIPLVQGKNSVGLATLFRQSQLSAFSESEIQLAQAIANQAATVLTNAILTSNTRGQLAQFSSLLRLSNVMAQATSMEEIFKGSRREILSLIEATGVAVMLSSEQDETLTWVYAHEYGQELDLSNIPPMPISMGLSGHVARNKTLLQVEKSPKIKEEYNTFSVGNESGFWLGIPLLVSSKLIGVLAVEGEEKFTEKEIELIETIAGPLGVAFNNILQLNEIQEALQLQSRQRVQLQTAAKVAASATRVQSLSELLQTSVDLIKEQFNLYYVGLFLIKPKLNQAILQAGTGQAGQIQISASHQLSVGGQSLIGGATADGIPRIIQDVLIDEEWLKNKHLPDTRSELALPLRVPQKVIGALTVQSIEPNIFDEDLVDTLQTMADQLAIAIENIRLLEQTQAKATDQAWLNEITTQLHQSTDVEKIIKIGLKSISERFDGAPIHLKLGRENSSKQLGTD